MKKTSYHPDQLRGHKQNQWLKRKNVHSLINVMDSEGHHDVTNKRGYSERACVALALFPELAFLEASIHSSCCLHQRAWECLTWDVGILGAGNICLKMFYPGKINRADNAKEKRQIVLLVPNKCLFSDTA